VPAEIKLVHLNLQAESLVLGDRIKRQTFRPCIDTLPSSTVAGALVEYSGGRTILGIGFLRQGSFSKALFVHSPRSQLTGVSVLPLTVEYLTPRHGARFIEGDVYLLHSSDAAALVPHLPLTIHMGALRYKGFGRCTLTLNQLTRCAPGRPSNPTIPFVRGFFRGRIREPELAAFGITVVSPRYGYLAEPDPNNPRKVRYRRAIMEGSLVEAPQVFVSEEYRYD